MNIRLLIYYIFPLCRFLTFLCVFSYEVVDIFQFSKLILLIVGIPLSRFPNICKYNHWIFCTKYAYFLTAKPWAFGLILTNFHESIMIGVSFCNHLLYNGPKS
jgi:hypothetical protein